MRVVYILSNRQQKELFRRGVELVVALPSPPHELLTTAMEWSRGVLEPHVASLVTEAEEELVTCNPLSSSHGLAGVLGEIDEYNRSKPKWLVSIEVVTVTLTPDDCRRHSSRVQWPGEVRIS